MNSGSITAANPLWQVFLDSKCSSATLFFRLHLSTRSYFHSPTPWINPSSNISRKVAKLMDSFRPGSSSYCPFQNEEKYQSPAEENTENASPEQDSNTILVRPSEV